MKKNRKTLIIAILSALSGFLLGGLITGYAVAYFIGQFFSDGAALNASNQLNYNIWALESIRENNNEKAIEQLEREAKLNLISADAYEEQVTSSTSAAIKKSISNAKIYFNQYPLEYINEDERILIEDALDKDE